MTKMFSESYLSGPSLLVVQIVSMLVLEVTLTNVTPYGSVSIEGLRLPEDRVDVTLHGTKKSPCVCHRACFVKACRCYSLVRTEDGGLDCLISLIPVPRHELIEDGSATTIFKTNYYPFGERFYHIVEAVPRALGRTICARDEAQVAVIDTAAKQKELLSAMEMANLSVVRIGLFMNVSETDLTPRWELFNGTTINASVKPTKTTNQCFTLSRSDDGQSTALENVLSCGELLHVVCQRDY